MLKSEKHVYIHQLKKGGSSIIALQRKHGEIPLIKKAYQPLQNTFR